MNELRYEDMKMKDDVLYCKDKKTKWRMHRDLINCWMFWIKFEDGSYSKDYYSFTRCKDNMKKLYVEEHNRRCPGASTEPAGAFK